jgi:hypothetical protein
MILKYVVCLSRINESWVHGGKSRLVSHLVTVGGKRTFDQYTYKYTVPMTWHVCKSDMFGRYVTGGKAALRRVF